MTASDPATTLAALTYPRTGKRGVPQQFPRRLYEMLESEAKLADASPDETFVISWSASGKAFRILDVELFADTILPRYFRTKKFSSFQRNLNLYGFAKVRRGPDTDMYAHSSFIRGQPEMLSKLRKSTSGSRRRLSKRSGDESDTSSDDGVVIRSVSPSPARHQLPRQINTLPHTVLTSAFQPVAPTHVAQTWLTFNEQPLAPKQDSTRIVMPRHIPAPSKCGEGRLHLLALAIEQGECLGM